MTALAIKPVDPITSESQKIIDDSFSVLINNYAPQPFVLDRGEGVYVWDTDGNKYIDCSIGYAVATLGHAPKVILDTINEQAGKLMICQASYATEPKLAAANTLINNSEFDAVYFSNSGTESVEASLKLARLWAYKEKGEGCNEIISFRNAFHGRTFGSASVTEKAHTQPYYAPYLPGVNFAVFNDLSSVEPLITDKTAAIIVEPVQGEGGLVPAEPEFLLGLRKLCDKHNIALIYDEVQAGMGRMGTFFAYESFGCCPDCIDGGDVNEGNIELPTPDIVALAKGIGGGFPVGAMVAKDKFAKHMGNGTHGTTYGGNPLSTAVANTVMNEILKPGFLEHIREMSEFFLNGLEEIKRESNKITDIRGKGLMLGIDTTVDIGTLIRAMQKNGLMCTQAGAATLRITPPLVVTKEEGQAILDIMSKTLKEI